MSHQTYLATIKFASDALAVALAVPPFAVLVEFRPPEPQTHLSIYLSIYLSLSINLSIHLPTCLSIYLPIYLHNVYVYMCMSAYLHVLEPLWQKPTVRTCMLSPTYTSFSTLPELRAEGQSCSNFVAPTACDLIKQQILC